MGLGYSLYRIFYMMYGYGRLNIIKRKILLDHKIESFFFFVVIEIKMNFNLVIKIAKTKGE